MQVPSISGLERRRHRLGSHCESGNGCGPWTDCETVLGSAIGSDHANENATERSSQTGNDFLTLKKKKEEEELKKAELYF